MRKTNQGASFSPEKSRVVELMDRTMQNEKARKTPNRNHRKIVPVNNFEASMRMTQALAA